MTLHEMEEFKLEMRERAFEAFRRMSIFDGVTVDEDAFDTLLQLSDDAAEAAATEAMFRETWENEDD